jgi:hypothetical protein
MKERRKDDDNGDTGMVKPGGGKCLVMGDCIVRNAGAEKSNMRFERFSGIRSDQLRRVV